MPGSSMRGAEPVNEEFEVGFNRAFETRWHFAEQAGHAVMVVFIVVAALGFLGRGPLSHASVQSGDGALSVDYEPVARHGTNTTVTVHLRRPASAPSAVELRLSQQMIEPMGFQRVIPLANRSSVGNAGMRLSFHEPPGQTDVLVRLELIPNAIGPVPMHVSNGASSIDWTVWVAP